jgi:hypothetical protein
VLDLGRCSASSPISVPERRAWVVRPATGSPSATSPSTKRQTGGAAVEVKYQTALAAKARCSIET